MYRLRWLVFFVVLCVGLSASGSSVSAATKQRTAPTCETKLSALRAHAEILKFYKKTENKDYATLRTKWVARTIYASQWVPKDALKTQKTIYSYDALRAASNKEIDSQIKQYQYLEKAKLSCSDPQTAKLTKQLLASNKVIDKNKAKETKFAKKDFKKSTDTLLIKLHDERHKHPYASHPKLKFNKA